MKILWVVSWYPNRTELFAGDFIQRHAQAVSLYHDVQVIHLVRDINGIVTNDVHVEEIINGRLNEKIVYYYSWPSRFSFLSKFFSLSKYRKLFRKKIEEYIRLQGTPELVHVHVGMKAGLMAQWLYKKHRIPYIITEHWTGFLPEAKHQFSNLAPYTQKAWKRLLHNAAGISSVSQYLARHIEVMIKKKIEIHIIPNVVNTDIFHPVTKKADSIVRFTHASGLDFQKNPEAILKAFGIVKTQTSAFYLSIFGQERRELLVLVKELGLEGYVQFHGEVSQPELAANLQQADGLILYSRYETFGCVVIEANASGLPVIASDIPVLHELLEDGKNGVMAKGDDPVALADKIIWFMYNRTKFDTNAIANDCARMYNYARVGRLFSEWYKAVVMKNNNKNVKQI